MTALQERLSRDNELREGLVSFRIWICLDEWSEDLSVLPEVNQECVTAPSSHDLYSFNGEAMQEVEECGTNAYAVTLEGLQTCLTSSGC